MALESFPPPAAKYPEEKAPIQIGYQDIMAIGKLYDAMPPRDKNVIAAIKSFAQAHGLPTDNASMKEMERQYRAGSRVRFASSGRDRAAGPDRD